MTRRRTLLRVSTLSVAAAGITWAAKRDGSTAFAGTPVEPHPAPPLVLPDDAGGTFDLAQHRGSVILVYFGYTLCSDVCPTTLDAIAAARSRLGPDANRITPVFVTLDPARDTAAALHDYLAAFGGPGLPAPIGLTGRADQVADAARNWGVTWRVAGNFIDHTSVVDAVAPDGRLRLRYGYSQLADPGAVAKDLHRLLSDA